MKYGMVFLLCCWLTTGMAQKTDSVTFLHEGLTLRATLTLPAGEAPLPAIVLVPGSGAMDRDGRIPMQGDNVACLFPELMGDTLYPYRELGDAFTAAGFAVLRYDKVEYTHRSAEELGEITFEKIWMPANSAVDYLRSRPEIDTSRLILVGHSEGSTLIPYLARRRGDIRALVSLAGARQPLDSLLVVQIRSLAEACGGDTTLAQLQTGQIAGYFAQVRAGSFTGKGVPLFGVTADVWAKYLAMADSVSINYNLADLPTLIIGLGLDFNVPPGETDRLEAEVPDAFVYRLPGLTHFMTPPDTPHVDPALSDAIVSWLDEYALQETADPLKWPKSFTAILEEGVLQVRSQGGPLEQVTITNAAGEIVVLEKNLLDQSWQVEVTEWPAGWYSVKAYRGAYEQGKWIFVK